MNQMGRPLLLFCCPAQRFFMLGSSKYGLNLYVIRNVPFECEGGSLLMTHFARSFGAGGACQARHVFVPPSQVECVFVFGPLLTGSKI